MNNTDREKLLLLEQNHQTMINKHKKINQKKYKNSDKGKITDKKYYNSNKRKIKSLEYYHKNKQKIRENNIIKNYGIDIDTYNLMLHKQNYLCAICMNKEIIKDKFGNIKDLSIDHNHITGKVRGLLCHKCNTAIGLMNDNILIFNRAIQYLSN